MSYHFCNDYVILSCSCSYSVASGNEGSNSCWAELEPFVIGTHKMYPLSGEMRQRLILHYLQPMGEYQEVFVVTYFNCLSRVSLIWWKCENCLTKMSIVHTTLGKFRYTSETNNLQGCTRFEQEAHHKVGLGETPRHFILKRCQYSSLEKFEDAFDTALYLMQTKSPNAALSAVFRTLMNANQKQLVTSYPVWL